MEREAEAKDNLWRARLDAVLMHRIWGSLIFLGIIYIIFLNTNISFLFLFHFIKLFTKKARKL